MYVSLKLGAAAKCSVRSGKRNGESVERATGVAKMEDISLSEDVGGA